MVTRWAFSTVQRSPNTTLIRFDHVEIPRQGRSGQVVALCAHCVCTVWALRAHCVHTAHAEAGILTQEYLSPDWLHSKAAKPT